MCQVGVRIQGEAVQSGDQNLWLFWREECVAKVYEVSNEPNLEIVVLQLLSIPAWYYSYRLSEEPAPGHFFVGVFG